MDLKNLLATVRRYWVTFVVVSGAVLALGLTGLLLAPKQYVSTSQLLVAIDGSTSATAYQNNDLVTARVHSYIALLTTDMVNQRVIARLGLSMSPAELASKISATNVPPDTSIIDIAVTDRSPEQAQRIAAAVATEFVSFTDALETPTGGDGQKIRTTVVTTARDPAVRTGDLARFGLGALIVLAALVIGAVAAWIRSLLDPVVRTAYRAAIATGLPVLSEVPSGNGTSADMLDGYRRLRFRLHLTNGTNGTNNTNGSKVILLTSADATEIKDIASNLAGAMELAGRHTIVLDAGHPITADSPDTDAEKSADAEEPTATSESKPSEPENAETETTESEPTENEATAPEPETPEPEATETETELKTTEPEPAEPETPETEATETETEPETPETEATETETEPETPETEIAETDSNTDPSDLPPTGWREAESEAAEAVDRIQQARNDHHDVIVVGPQILLNYTASFLSDFCDAAVIVAAAESTLRRDLVRAVKALTETGAPLKGVVLVHDSHEKSTS
ncbi:Wzz/FepE/Etk N-terminal domain-containing protein [Mycobacterium sp. OTB74]|jgi:capsular polysaccharide biosynthesis protein|uniref:Wzz/FepE/Etk N-terminal domain-containing protein n=1 Tax=Mycobacterium sp. OTB74 TaxID=1853452 RepID=UPI00247494F7|nr:Wzz/FepE/Etk N-terminal domain-containing protein [Mycobacterium sp. OTB74]MDH6242405.1 capsular polysaccharide biosynthesis protein [Mycobacterium sp. OTB74]